MNLRVDLTGQSFGNLQVLEFAGIRKRGAYWRVRCECNRIFETCTERLRVGIKSCGCKRLPNAHAARRTHGLSGDRIFEIWRGMVARCTRPYNASYANYGGAGISVCEEWQDPVVFREWALANGYDERLTIDRICSNGNYSPDNCRWATTKEQGRNRRATKIIEYQGRDYTLTELAEIAGLSITGLSYRLRKGWTVDRAVSTPSIRART